MEHWVEINLSVKRRAQDAVLLDVLKPHVESLKKEKALVTWHFFREPEIRFRVRLRSRAAKLKETQAVAAIANCLRERGLVSKWQFGNHGERGKIYVGEVDRYGCRGWRIAQDYFNSGAETALRLLALKRKDRLENPLWAKGLGNPWEGGRKNPWRDREQNPLVYHWSRYVHLFTNQLGFDIDDETRLCTKQAARYRVISTKLRMKW